MGECRKAVGICGNISSMIIGLTCLRNLFAREFAKATGSLKSKRNQGRETKNISNFRLGSPDI